MYIKQLNKVLIMKIKGTPTKQRNRKKINTNGMKSKEINTKGSKTKKIMHNN